MSINVGNIENEIKALLDEQGNRKENDNGESLARGLAKIVADAILSLEVSVNGVACPAPNYVQTVEVPATIK